MRDRSHSHEPTIERILPVAKMKGNETVLDITCVKEISSKAAARSQHREDIWRIGP